MTGELGSGNDGATRPRDRSRRTIAVRLPQPDVMDVPFASNACASRRRKDACPRPSLSRPRSAQPSKIARNEAQSVQGRSNAGAAGMKRCPAFESASPARPK